MQLPPDLSADTDAVLAINVATSAVIAASPSGRALLGYATTSPLPFVLDSAMPALATMRDLFSKPTDGPVRDTLVFWALGRAVASECVMTPSSPATRTPIVVVRCGPELGADANDAALSEIPAGAALPDRNDDETLKEIARRIREGSIERPATADVTAPDSARDRASDAFAFDDALSVPSHRTTKDLAKLAHELKTPLTAIASAAEIMRDEQLGAMGNARYLDYARDIHESAAHGLALISRLLSDDAAEEAPRLENGSLKLNDIVARTVSTLQPLAAERGLLLATDLDDSIPPIVASATTLRQILLNLLMNALKFTPPGGDVRAVTGVLPGGSVFLVVRDTGIGIDDATLFDATRADPDTSTMREGGGFGIGLPLVYQLVGELGASIEFDSAPGKGTVALISFPKMPAG